MSLGFFWFFFFCSFRDSVARRISSGNKSCFILWDETRGGKEKRGRAELTRGFVGLVSSQAAWQVRTGFLKGDKEKNEVGDSLGMVA